MLKGFGLNNFKSFGGSQQVRLAPISLIFGPNSSGKSAFLQAMTQFKHVVTEARATGNLFSLSINDGYHDHGAIQNLFFKHNTSKAIDLECFFSENYKIRFRFKSEPDKEGNPQKPTLESLIYGEKKDPISNWLNVEMMPDRWVEKGEMINEMGFGYKIIPPEIGYPLTFEKYIFEKMNIPQGRGDIFSKKVPMDIVGLSKDESANVSFLAAFLITHINLFNNGVVPVEKIAEMFKDFSTLDDFLNISEGQWGFIKEIGMGDFYEHLKPEKMRVISGGPGMLPCVLSTDEETVIVGAVYAAAQEKGYYFGKGCFSDFADSFYQAMEALSFIGPQRADPLRVYRPEESPPKSVGIDGSLWLHVANSNHSEDALKVLDEWLQKLGLPLSLRIKSIGDNVSGFFLSYQLIEKNLNVKLSLKDVGFGVGQILPILVEGISKKGRIVLVEQPELHLHPKLQADLADFFIENSKANENQWIIETHSELLILRVLRHIRRGLLSPEDVSVLYVNPGKDGSEISELRIDEKGDFIDPWPHGFFDEDVVELFGD